MDLRLNCSFASQIYPAFHLCTFANALPFLSSISQTPFLRKMKVYQDHKGSEKRKEKERSGTLLQ